MVTSVRIFCKALFTNNNIKVVFQMHTFLMDQFLSTIFGNQLLKNKCTNLYSGQRRVQDFFIRDIFHFYGGGGGQIAEQFS